MVDIKFMEVTLYDGTKVAIRLDSILYFREAFNGGTVIVLPGELVYTTAAYEDIKNSLRYVCRPTQTLTQEEQN